MDRSTLRRFAGAIRKSADAQDGEIDLRALPINDKPLSRAAADSTQTLPRLTCRLSALFLRGELLPRIQLKVAAR
jgi:hypothetical protein